MGQGSQSQRWHATSLFGTLPLRAGLHAGSGRAGLRLPHPAAGLPLFEHGQVPIRLMRLIYSIITSEFMRLAFRIGSRFCGIHSIKGAPLRPGCEFDLQCCEDTGVCGGRFHGSRGTAALGATSASSGLHEIVVSWRLGVCLSVDS